MQHKLIMENWRGFLDCPEKPYLIYESRGFSHRVDFNNLLKEIDTGVVTHQQAYLIFEKAFDYGQRQLLEEGLWDLIMQGYDKAGEIVSNIAADVKAAWQKISEFYLDMVLKAMNLASRGISFFVKYANKIFSAIDKFQKKHPILYKIIVGIMICLIIYALFGSSNAQAAVKVGNKTLDQGTYDAMQGALNSAGRDPDYAMAIGKAQVVLERAHQANEAINIKDLAPTIQEAFKVVDNTLNQAAGGDAAAGQLFSKWMQVGEKLKFTATGF